MSRITIPAQPSEKSTKILGDIEKSLGMTPNMFKLMSNSPSALEAYMGFSAALSKGALSAQDREQIALAVAGFDKCEYCAAAHTVLGQKAGVAAAEAVNNLRGKSENPRTAAMIKFCLAVLKTKGFVSDEELSTLRAAHFSDEQIVEIVATISLNMFTNYFNHVAGTDVDFPKVILD